MNYKTLLLLLGLFVRYNFSAQEFNEFTDKHFLIVASTKNIEDAVATAKKAAQKTGLKFENNGLQAHPTNGATFPKEACEGDGFEFPCYIARGRYDDGCYISVEYSGGYSDFQKGYFIVIAASGQKDETYFKETLAKVRKSYPKSYVKSSKVYMGCMH